MTHNQGIVDAQTGITNRQRELEKRLDEQLRQVQVAIGEPATAQALLDLVIGFNAEIERLRAALERIAKGCDLSNEAQAIAREALKR